MPIRIEEERDHDAVGTVHRSAFGGEHGGTVAGLVDALRPASLSLVSEEAGAVAGHIMFSRGLLDAPRRLVTVQTLSPLGVAPRWQGRGIGSALVRDGLRRLDERGVPLVFVEGDPAFYSRLGFGPGKGLGFRRLVQAPIELKAKVSAPGAANRTPHVGHRTSIACVSIDGGTS
jgi:putative acetyltransferase